MPDRQSHRLIDHDYTEPGSYFVTICTRDRACVFGDVVDGTLQHTLLGVLVERELLLIPVRRSPRVRLGPFVVMPNHVHAIIINCRGDRLVHRKVRAGRGAEEARANDRAMSPANPLPPEYKPYRNVRATGDIREGGMNAAPTLEALSLGAIVGTFKAGVTREARRLGIWGKAPLWQRAFHDHVVRGEHAFGVIARYIRSNPWQWSLDRENPSRTGDDEFDQWLTEEGKKPV